MPTVIFDLVDGAEASRDKDGSRAVRTGYIKDLDVTGDPQDILARAVDLLPAEYSAFSAAYPTLQLVRHVVVPFGRANNRARFSLFYEAAPIAEGGGGPIIFSFERKRQMVNVQTQLHPSNGEATLNIDWRSPVDHRAEQPQVASMSIMTPLASIVATGYVRGTPPTAYDAVFGRVNNQPWKGKPKGFWLFVGAEETTRDFGRTYEIRLEFLSKWTEDWTSWAVYRHPATGLFIPVKKSDRAELKSLAYSYAIAKRNGITRAGLYDLGDFNNTFGF
jgi:hypothetical protein